MDRDRASGSGVGCRGCSILAAYAGLIYQPPDGMLSDLSAWAPRGGAWTRYGLALSGPLVTEQPCIGRLDSTNRTFAAHSYLACRTSAALRRAPRGIDDPPTKDQIDLGHPCLRQSWLGDISENREGLASWPRGLVPPSLGQIPVERGRRRTADSRPARNPLLGQVEQRDRVEPGDQNAIECSY